MCDRALYLSPGIISRAEYGIEYGPSLEYLRIIGVKALTERYSTIMKPGPDGVYRESDVITGYRPAQYREATTTRYKPGISYVSKNPVHPSYSQIKNETKISIDGIDHTVTIQDHTVMLDGAVIARAPGNKTRSTRDTFCKAVVWSLQSEPDNIREHMKNRVSSLSRFNLPLQDGVPA